MEMRGPGCAGLASELYRLHVATQQITFQTACFTALAGTPQKAHGYPRQPSPARQMDQAATVIAASRISMAESSSSSVIVSGGVRVRIFPMLILKLSPCSRAA